MTRRLTLALALLTPLALAGCGGVDRDDPVAVAVAYAESYYRCGDDGAGARWEITVPSSADDTRERELETERRDGCTPRDVPEITGMVDERESGVQIVTVFDASAPASAQRQVPIGLVNTDDGWKVDPGNETGQTWGDVSRDQE